MAANRLADAGVLTISGTGAIQNWGYVSPPWRSCKDSITSIVMENGVTSIGDGSFRDLKSVTSVTIPEGVTHIGGNAFSGCAMADVTIPAGVTSIGVSAFYNCGALTSVTIPAGGNYHAIVLANGKLTVTARSSGGEGGKVTAGRDGSVTITPDEGYQTAKITVNGKEVEIPEGGKLTGLKRTDKVVVTFEPIPAPAAEQFTDVTAGAWYENAVTYVVEKGLFNGTSATEFSPSVSMTRGMLVTVLYRLENEPEAAGTEMFRDVADDQYYTEAVAWAAERRIVNGKGGGILDPQGQATRAEVAAMLTRYIQAAK